MRSWKRWILLFVAALVWMGASASVAWAKTPDEGRVVVGNDYALLPGQVLDGSLLVVAGEASVARGARVTGDVSVVGGDLRVDGIVGGDLSVTGGEATLDGTVKGDVSVLGGLLNLGPHAVVAGKVRQLAGEIHRAPGAKAEIRPEGHQPPPGLEFLFPWGQLMGMRPAPLGWLARLFWKMVLSVLQAIALAVLAGLVFLFPDGFARRAIVGLEETPLVSGGVGLLIVALLPVVMVALVVTLVLIPLAVVLGAVAGVAALYGWLVLGLYVGERLMQIARQTWHPAGSAALGTFVLTLVAAGLNVVPCIGWVPGFLAGAVGLGAVSLALWETWQQQTQRGKAAQAEALSPQAPSPPHPPEQAN